MAVILLDGLLGPAVAGQDLWYSYPRLSLNSSRNPSSSEMSVGQP